MVHQTITALVALVVLGGGFGPARTPPMPLMMSAVESRFPNGPVVILGASYAAGWTPVFANVAVLNKGVTGQQSFELLARFDADVVSHRPRAVIIWGFINDIFRAESGRVDEAVARARSSLEAIVTRSRAAGIEPILATEVTLRTQPQGVMNTLASWAGTLLGKTSYQQQINERVLSVNDWLRAFAASHGILLLDLQPVVSDGSGGRAPECATADGSHISAEGYRRLSAYAEPRLAAHFAAKTSQP